MKTGLTKEEKKCIDKIIDKIIESQALLKGNYKYSFGMDDELKSYEFEIKNLFSNEAKFQHVRIVKFCSRLKDVSPRVPCDWEQSIVLSGDRRCEFLHVNKCGNHFDDFGFSKALKRLDDYIEENKYQIMAVANEKSNNFPCSADELF